MRYASQARCLKTSAYKPVWVGFETACLRYLAGVCRLGTEAAYLGGNLLGHGKQGEDGDESREHCGKPQRAYDSENIYDAHICQQRDEHAEGENNRDIHNRKRQANDEVPGRLARGAKASAIFCPHSIVGKKSPTA